MENNGDSMYAISVHPLHHFPYHKTDAFVGITANTTLPNKYAYKKHRLADH